MDAFRRPEVVLDDALYPCARHHATASQAMAVKHCEVSFGEA